MEKTYQPQSIEKKWSHYWEQNQFDLPSGKGIPYCIMLPPPNVTGSLHMGHGFQQTLMDVLIRWQRMAGKNTLWQAGTDHAGIATQMVVERQLAEEGINRHELGRENFVKRIWEWREQSGSMISSQIRRLGASIDWTRERFSMDKSISDATREAFIRLYEEGLIYRGKALVNWDPQLHTALSDLEVESETIEGSLWHIRYPICESNEHLIIATTRPETLLGDTAVAVHPDDERYAGLIGKQVQLPLANRLIPIIADDHVDPKFGTGCVKITPAHDFNDYAIGKRHDLPMINIFTVDAHLNENVPEIYRGMDRFNAREKIIEELKSQGLLEKTQPHQINLPRGDRSGAIIEPMLTDQWFVKAKQLAKPAIDVVENGKLEFVPSNWKKTYLQWLYHIEDWCISRQLWWGHRIPVWYDDNKKSYVGHNEEDVRARYHLNKNVILTQDNDVLDTWFSAALWPFSSLGWPEKTPELDIFYPSSVLVTGFDIIFFWVARMVMMGLKLMGDIPFKQVYIHGLIRDRHGKKMSKSKGNVLDPIDLMDGIALEPLIKKRVQGLMQPQMAKSIEKATRDEFPNGIAAFGTDALRFTFCALASTGRDINFDMGRIEGYRNFCNKLWNASRYVIMNTEGKDLSQENCDYSLADQWIRSKIQETIKATTKALTQYRFDRLAQILYEFTWNEYCDWYLELSKCVLNDSAASPELLRGTRRTLLVILESLLRLLHPIIPFITEEIWQKIADLLGQKGDTIMLQPFPMVDSKEIDTQAQSDIEWLKNVVNAIRNLRSEAGISPSKKITVIFNKGDKQDKARMNTCNAYLIKLANIDGMTWKSENEKLPASATAVVDALEIHIPLAGLIDKHAEIKRLNKEIEKLMKEREQSEKKLANPNYVKKAPAEVVQKERDRLEKSEETLKKLKVHYQRIEEL